MAAFDPAGETTRMLRTLGCRVRRWDGEPGDDLVVIGRKALSGGSELPAGLEEHVRRGGRALLFAQDPAWLRNRLAFRTTAFPSRRAFAVRADHPTIAGLDETDLRDWNGVSALVDAYPSPAWDDIKRGEAGGCPWYGWHWGNRGAVTSAPIEKPHRSGWTPILECEFDLAYTPLAELDYGRGRITLCTLDLEDHVEGDPAARRLAGQILDYVLTAELRPRAERVRYVGGPEATALLDGLGLRYGVLGSVPEDADLLIVGPGAVDSDSLTRFVERGGKALVLAHSSPAGPLGVTFAKRDTFAGSLDVPDWPECRGLSPSDLRWRTAHPAWLVAGGCEAGADGLLGRKRIGAGTAVFCQVDPGLFDTETQTYFRYTRWRQTRALAQVLANLGAAFDADERVFHPQEPDSGVIPLGGEWRARITTRVPVAPNIQNPVPDPGISDAARTAVSEGLDDRDWQSVELPQLWEGCGGEWAELDGEAVFRKAVDVPAEMAGMELVLSLGPVDDFDETFFNGVSVGSIGIETPAFYSVPRVYTVPAELVRPGRNVIAVRVFDHFGGGGLGGQATDMFLRIPKGKDAGFYHPDYRDDFAYGDDPYRYCRW